MTALPLALSIGDPSGIGPEIALAAWGRRAADAVPAFYLLGDPALLAARAAALDPDELELPVRYNPTSCDCPAWEVLIAESWRRVALEPEPPTRGAPLRSLTLRPTDATVEAEGWIYAVYAVVR